MIPILLALVQFLAGEALNYEVRYGPLKAGQLELKVEEIAPLVDGSCYHFSARLRSNPDLSFLFAIDDRLESWARVSDLLTLRSIKDVSERRYKNLTQVEFDYEAGLIRYSDGSSLPLIPGCRDLLTIWYYLRTLPIELGREFPILNHTDRHTYQACAVVADTGLIKLPAGQFHCFRIDSRIENEGRSGRFRDFSIWISRDEPHLPVLIQSSFILGRLSAVLTGVD